MSVEFVLFIGRETLMTAVTILVPILGSALVVGLAVGIFQAVTQIHEMTLTFIPKIGVVGLIIIVFMQWFLDVLLGFTTQIFNQIPVMGL